MGRLQRRRIQPVRNIRTPRKVTLFWQQRPHRCQIEPGWHAWISYMVDKPPTEDPLLQTKVRPWELPDHRPNFTQSRGAFKTYSTWVPIFWTLLLRSLDISWYFLVVLSQRLLPGLLRLLEEGHKGMIACFVHTWIRENKSNIACVPSSQILHFQWTVLAFLADFTLN